MFEIFIVYCGASGLDIRITNDLGLAIELWLGYGVVESHISLKFQCKCSWAYRLLQRLLKYCTYFYVLICSELSNAHTEHKNQIC